VPPEVRGGAPAGPLVVDTVALLRRAGTREVLRLETSLDGLAAGEFAVVDGRLEIDLVIEATADGGLTGRIAAKGTALGEWTGPCRRCLDPIVAPLEVEVDEIFERQPTEGETWPIDDERIDLEPMLREAALLSLPLVPLCRDECAGPEPDRFPPTVDIEAKADADPDDDAPAPDPRWAALDGLRFDE